MSAGPKRILVLNGNPDTRPERLISALLDAYATGAESRGHEVRRLNVADIDFPPVVSTSDVEGDPPRVIADAQAEIVWAEHIVIGFPLWIGGPPALLKSFFEQVCRYDFTFTHSYRPLLRGRTARLLITMVVPEIVYHLIFSPGVRGFVRAVLWSAGIKPTRSLLIGNVFKADADRSISKARKLGESAR